MAGLLSKTTVLTLCASILLWGVEARSQAHAQDEAPHSEAEVHARSEFEAGRAAYDHGLFAEARQHFERAHVFSPKPELLYNIGRAADSEGELERAIAAYSSYLEAFPTAHNRDFVSARIARMRALQDAAQEPESNVAATSADAVKAEGPRITTVTLASERTPLQAEARSEGMRWYRSPWLWAAVGAVVTAGVAGTLIATRSQSARVEQSYGGSTGTVLSGPLTGAP